jgi:aspartate aminotransferase
MSDSVDINPDIINLKESSTLKINQTVRKLRSEGKEVAHFGFGQSPFPVHPLIVEELRKYAGEKDYLPTLGLLELREAIVNYYKGLYGYNFTVDTVCVGPGSKELIFQALFVLEGTVIVPAPSWVSYGPQVNAKGKHITRVITKKENNYKLQGEELAQVCTTLTSKQKFLLSILQITLLVLFIQTRKWKISPRFVRKIILLLLVMRFIH